MSADFRDRHVLITGGTRGLGLATGLALARRGAECSLTYRWGGADEDEIRTKFSEVGGPQPFIVEADASNPDDTRSLLEFLNERWGRIDVLVSGVSFAQRTTCVEDITRRSLLRSMEYSVWPTIEYLQQIKSLFGSYPRYVVGLSSPGPDQLFPNYDVVAACKSAMETIFRYLAYRLADDDVRINIVRTMFVPTEALDVTMGSEFAPFMRSVMPEVVIPVEPVADAVVALCSGMMDGVSGQVLLVDGGGDFGNCMMGIFDKHKKEQHQ